MPKWEVCRHTFRKIWPGVTHNKPLGVGYESRVGNDNNIIITFIKSQLYMQDILPGMFSVLFPVFPIPTPGNSAAVIFISYM